MGTHEANGNSVLNGVGIRNRGSDFEQMSFVYHFDQKANVTTPGYVSKFCRDIHINRNLLGLSAMLRTNLLYLANKFDVLARLTDWLAIRGINEETVISKISSAFLRLDVLE